MKCYASDYCQKDKSSCSDVCGGYRVLRALYNLSRIPERYRYTIALKPENGEDLEAFTKLDNYKNDVLSMVDEGRGLYIWGKSTGNGKTSWACKIMSYFFRKIAFNTGLENEGLYIFLPTFLEDLRDNYDNKDKTYEAGTVHCYTCGYTADLPQFVADLLGLSSPVEGFKWLVNQYNYQTEERELPDLDMYRGSTAKSSVLEESLVKQYTQNLLQSEEACRYLHKRRIANWVLEAYELGFDPEDKTVLFPVRGMDGKVIFYKGRSIAGKHFYNAKEIDKTSVVFGLWEILNGSFSWGTSDQIEEVWITESEIDALSLISYGVPAVAIMGSHISEDQCKELERTPFRRFVLATDNDDAGRKGASQIKRLLIPKGFRFINLKWHTSLKDINDLVKEYGDGWKDHLTGY